MIDGDFLVFCAPGEGVPLEIGYRRWESKTRMMGYQAEKSLTISSAVWIEYTNVTDGQTDTWPQQRPRLRMTSRGKNALKFLLSLQENLTAYKNKISKKYIQQYFCTVLVTTMKITQFFFKF